MIVYTVYGMMCMFLYVEREQSVVARGEKRDVRWGLERPVGWVKGFQALSQVRAHACVPSARLKGSASGRFKIEPGCLPDLPASPRRRAPADLCLPRGGRLAGGAPSWRKKSDTLTLSDVTCQGLLTF